MATIDIPTDFSIQSVFDHKLPRTCPVAETSRIILAGTDEDLVQLVSNTPSSSSGEGFRMWDYDNGLVGKDLDFRWINEMRFEPRECSIYSSNRC
jgi:hypothetical protein